MTLIHISLMISDAELLYIKGAIIIKVPVSYLYISF